MSAKVYCFTLIKFDDKHFQLNFMKKMKSKMKKVKNIELFFGFVSVIEFQCRLALVVEILFIVT